MSGRAGHLLALLIGGACFQEVFSEEIDQPPHDYWNRPLSDPFTRLKSRFESEDVSGYQTGEKAFLAKLLEWLDVPATSQMLVFSTTSLQLSLISPSRPRALYFNEEVYVGFIPGGRIEIVSLDPELGGVFYILDIPRGESKLTIDRSNRCMNCHAGEDTGFVPGLVIKSVIPGPGGGSLTSYRRATAGHGIPFAERFGGWYVTGTGGLTNHWGNLTGELSSAGLATRPVPPGERFDWGRYPVATSDLLPHLLHEHQAGFINRVVKAGYRTRTLLHANGSGPDAESARELDDLAGGIVRYMLFADEAPLPPGGIEGDPGFKRDFARNRRPSPGGESLKDLDLETRLMRHRCSYMIYSPVFASLPPAIKSRIYSRLKRALSQESGDADGAHLSPAEKIMIREILAATLEDLPQDWKS